MKISQIAVFVGLSLCFPTIMNAQNDERFTKGGSNFTVELPPLSVVIDSAISHNSGIRAREIDVEIQKVNLKQSKNFWARSLGVSTDLRYGTFDHFSTSVSDIGVPVNSTVASTDMRYGAGAYMKLPLQDLLNRKSEKKIFKLEIEKAESMVGVQREELRRQVIVQYNDLILKQRLFKLKIKQYETANINMQMAEKEFVNGVIPISEYSRNMQITTGIQADYENSRMELISAVMVLEDMTGISLKIVNVSTEPHETH